MTDYSPREHAAALLDTLAASITDTGDCLVELSRLAAVHPATAPLIMGRLEDLGLMPAEGVDPLTAEGMLRPFGQRRIGTRERVVVPMTRRRRR